MSGPAVRLHEHDDDEHQWAIELDDCFVIVRFLKDSDAVAVDYPAGQLEKWEDRAAAAGVPFDDYLVAILDVAFRKLGEGESNGEWMN